MTKTPDVTPGQTIASAWGNEIRDRTIQVFASNAERDGQWSSPPNGAVCFTVDTGTMWMRIGGAWLPQNGAYSIGGIVQTSIGSADTVLQLASGTVTKNMTRVGNRVRADYAGWYHVAPSITFYAAAANATGELWVQAKLFDSGGAFYFAFAAVQYLFGTDWYTNMSPTWDINLPTGAAIEFNARIQTPGGGFSAQADPNTMINIHRIAN